MKKPSILVLACLLVGCGGGGDPAPADPGNGGDPGPDNSDAALLVLEQCAAAEIGGLLDAATQLAELASGTLAGVTLQLVDDTAKQIQLTIDTDNDGLDEVLGGLQFFDSAGDPANVDLTGIQTDNNLTQLPTVLGTMPDGGFVTTRLEAVDGSGSTDARVTFQGGLPQTISGFVISTGTACQSSFSLEDVDAAGLLLGSIPTNVTIGLSLTSNDGSGTVTGDAFFNGSDTVRLEVKFDGENPVYTFNMSLSTGLVTQA